jgi:hypothetical protein
VLTNNTRAFTRAVVPVGSTVPAVLTPDQLFSGLITESLGADLAQTVLRISSKLKNPLRSQTEIVDGLEVCGLIETAQGLRSFFL